MEKDNFKIHSIALCKNEEDVIYDCLKEASEWSDFIYVYDGESTDNTWEEVHRVAEEEEGIIPWKQSDKTFKEGLRAEVFNAFRERARPGDWWCELNVDEYYIDDPRKFLSEVPSSHHVVWGINVEYYITYEDLDQIDFSSPWSKVRPQLQYYKCFWSERRMFEHRNGLVWDESDSWPKHLGIVTPERIRFKHYPYRSPEQIQTRLDVRRKNRREGFEGWDHAKEESWKEKIEDKDNCYTDNGSGEYKINHSELPNHLSSNWKRMIKYIMHGTGIWA